MNSEILKKTYYTTRSWIFAISATLIVHLILFVAFVPTKRIKAEINTNQHPQIMMLPLDMANSNSKINELIACMNNENPTLLVDPGNKFGYRAIIKKKISLPLPKNIPDYKSELLAQIIFLPSMKVPEIPLKFNASKKKFESLALYSFAFFPIKITISQDKITTYPYVEDVYQGYILPVKFFNLGEKNSLIKKYNPSSSTVIKMNYPEDKSLLPFGNIVESCGVSELDTIGLNTITTQNFPDQIKSKLAGKNIHLKIDWQAPYKKLKN